MRNDEAFLHAIADKPADDATRLAYADWLEERGDPRADFLRVQCALEEQANDKARYRDLCKREKKLFAQLDPAWIMRVRRFTTGAPCCDLGSLVPDLAPLARTTTRLHPHRAAAPIPEWMSKIGGRFLWPRNKPWPSCADCKVHLTPVLQLRSKDVPDLAFPAGADLMQLFWCPDEAAHGYEPAPQIWWRAAKDIAHARTDAPDLSKFPRTSDWEGYSPFECSVHPERVLEYPLGDDLWAIVGAEEAARIQELIASLDVRSMAKGRSETRDAEGLAFSELGRCPGTKVGGRPSIDRKGRRFDHLVTLSTWEFDAGNFRRWLAVEDQRLLATPGKPLSWEQLCKASAFKSLREMLGMQLGRTQRAHIYVGRAKKPWEVYAYVND